MLKTTLNSKSLKERRKQCFCYGIWLVILVDDCIAMDLPVCGKIPNGLELRVGNCRHDFLGNGVHSVSTASVDDSKP